MIEDEIFFYPRPEMHPKAIIEGSAPRATIRSLSPTSDSTRCGARSITVQKARTLLTSGGLGTMGFGLGAARRMLCAGGERTVLFTGDGVSA